ncbi:MAG: hypothetical protein JSU69_04055 [Candidatus Zixiibacteriota bacterium]|nr:MAG: hypothetical protein JSU69_04055 [candidate division Zixibacteria bacterium]
MRKTFLMTFLVALTAVSSGLAVDFGFGAFGGAVIPIAQEDQGSGAVFGFRGQVSVLPGIIVEPNVSFAKYGEAEFEFGTREGSKITSYGVEVLIGARPGQIGFGMFGIIGAGAYSMSRLLGSEDVTKFGFSTGVGFSFGLDPKIGLDLRGKVDVISSEGGATKKAAAIIGGLN